MPESNVNMKFTAQTADAQKRIEDLEKEVERLNKEARASSSASSAASSGLGEFSASAVKATAAIAATLAVVKVLASAAKECISAFREQELAETRLNAVLKATGNQAGLSTQDLLELAAATQKVTRFGDEAVIEAEKLLVATQSLDKEGLQRAIEASADLAEAMGTDITSAASTLAYALQDPEQGLSRLRRQGIAFTDEEIEQVKVLQESGQLYEAQALVLEKIESRFKGVAKAVGDTPTGTLDKIKNVWGDIKEGLGGALLDALAPALDLIYKALLKISDWVNKARASVKTEQEVNSLTNVLQNQGSVEGFSDELLYAAIDAYQRKIDTWNLKSNYSQGAYQRYINTLQAELDKRAEDRQKELFGDGTIKFEITNKGSGEDVGEQAVSAVEAFLKANGSASASYKNAEYQAIIDQAEELRNKMLVSVDENGKRTFNKTTREEWGIETLDEFIKMYDQLGEIIDTTKEKQAKLFETPEEAPGWLPTDYLAEYQTAVEHLEVQISALDDQIALVSDPATLEYLQDVRDGLQAEYDELTNTKQAVDTLGEYISKNVSLSATAQSAAIDRQIAEAESWKAAAEEGSEEIRILDEIIERLKEQKGLLEETELTWQDQAKAILSAWSPVVNRFQEMTGAITGFMTQMWSSQADELEEALARDKAAGDMSEQEEAQRLKTIDDLRRKSFEAEKANSISNALINGALAITQCLTEGIQGYIMAGIISATTAVQVATIANQQYTPMAKGGIVTQATPILAGEAGPEAIIPLSEGRAQQYLGNGGGVVINITIQGNADEEAIYDAIERAQRTGYLPSWNYVR